MICLNCKEDMIVVEYHDIEVDYCPGCEGIWFDAGELELLLEQANLESPIELLTGVLASPDIVLPHVLRKCPICGRIMKVKAIGEPPIHIDICRYGDGIWFDGGELHQLITHLVQTCHKGEDAKQEVICFLGDMFQLEKTDSGEQDKEETK